MSLLVRLSRISEMIWHFSRCARRRLQVGDVWERRDWLLPRLRGDRQLSGVQEFDGLGVPRLLGDSRLRSAARRDVGETASLAAS